MKHVHIVSFDIPYPANYGGVIDVFYRIKALSQLGLAIHLHCYEYGRVQADELQQYCASVTYYKRNTRPQLVLKRRPYIVATRSHRTLLQNLLQDKHPILFEGLHCTHLLKNKRLQDRLKIVRTHNIEHEYYWHLCKAEKYLPHKMFFATESLKLKYYEDVLKYADIILSISANDRAYFQQYGRSLYVPAFRPDFALPDTENEGRQGVLYHGNLSVSENIKAVMFLLNNVFNKIDLPVTIAGSKPSKAIIDRAAQLKNVELVADPTEAAMQQLIATAQINLLVTFQSTGIKLKLLNALQYGSHCIVNKQMIEKTGLNSTCTVANSPEDMITAIYKLHNLPFSKKDYKMRQKLLNTLYSNRKSAEKIASLL